MKLAYKKKSQHVSEVSASGIYGITVYLCYFELVLYSIFSFSSPWQQDIGGKIEKLKLDMPLCPPDEDASDEQRDQLQKGWTQEPYSKAALRKKSDWVENIYCLGCSSN